MSTIDHLSEEINDARTRLGLPALTSHQLAAIVHAQNQFEAFVQGAVNPSDYRLRLQLYGVDLPTQGPGVAEAKREYVVELRPFHGSNAIVEVGPFIDRAEAERTLRGSMATGRFVGGTIVTKERES